MTTSGEKWDANIRAMEQDLPELINKMGQFEPRNVFNVDEYGFFYKLVLRRSVVVGPSQIC